ncbi:hypothetical protein CF326_g8336 [Tilletia indica]|nr:hypothetical protein CF326_g8336 [Tilletia indica]
MSSAECVPDAQVVGHVQPHTVIPKHFSDPERTQLPRSQLIRHGAGDRPITQPHEDQVLCSERRKRSVRTVVVALLFSPRGQDSISGVGQPPLPCRQSLRERPHPTHPSVLLGVEDRMHDIRMRRNTKSNGQNPVVTKGVEFIASSAAGTARLSQCARESTLNAWRTCLTIWIARSAGLA